MSRILERRAINRIQEIADGPKLKKKGAKCIKRDNLLASLVKKHAAGDLATDDYFDAVVKVNGDWDLPGNLQILQQRYV